MPIKWSAVKVRDKLDEIEEIFRSIQPTLWQIREEVTELRQIPNLPGYIGQPATMITDRVERFNEYMKGYVERIRKLIPQDALKEERKALEYGSQQPLI